MAGVKKFEELDAWKKSRELAVRIYKLTNKGEFSRDFGFRDQIRRASVSVMSNIAEGFERGSRPDFHRFLVIAKASCAEVRSQLYLALDIGYITQDEFAQTMALAEEASRIIGGLRRSVDPNNRS
jgi:four helix bundle protein